MQKLEYPANFLVVGYDTNVVLWVGVTCLPAAVITAVAVLALNAMGSL